MKVGIQLYSVKEHLMKDGIGTMKAVAEAGYKYIEPFCSERFPIGEAEKRVWPGPYPAGSKSVFGRYRDHHCGRPLLHRRF